MTGKTNANAKIKTAARKVAARPKKRQAKPVATTHKLVWRDITCRVRHTPDYISMGWSHIDIVVLKPKGAPLPITETGYRSHFLGHDQLQRAGGPVRFFLDWIEREARRSNGRKPSSIGGRATCSRDDHEGRSHVGRLSNPRLTAAR